MGRTNPAGKTVADEALGDRANLYSFYPADKNVYDLRNGQPTYRHGTGTSRIASERYEDTFASRLHHVSS
ncbi:hypothetical protein TNCV_1724121 [Trichonephila clavipes]|nr:hypothetical protein TNCV_1724121 [Trichonephila clavipes]